MYQLHFLYYLKEKGLTLKMKMNIPVKKIAVAGVLSAVEIVLGLTGVGLIMLPFGAAVTVLQVPAIIGAILEGPFVGFFIGLLFGIFTIIQSALVAATPIDMAFLSYPVIAIVPRMLIGPAAWLVYALITGGLKKDKQAQSAALDQDSSIDSARIVKPVREYAGVILGAVTGSLTNTLLVLGGFGVFKIFPWAMIFPVAILNGPLEAAASVIITCAVIALWKGLSGRGKSKLMREAARRSD